MNYSRQKVTLLTSAIIMVLALPLFAAYLIHAKRQAELTKLVSHVHNLSLHLKGYVQDHGSFPPTLESLVTSGDLHASLLKPPSGASLSYSCPSPTTSETSTVLVVTYREHRIVVTKDFSRILDP